MILFAACLASFLFGCLLCGLAVRPCIPSAEHRAWRHVGHVQSACDRAHHELAPATAQGGDPLVAARFLPELPSVAPAAGGRFLEVRG